jgi:ubiquinone/menaquinone biosynthesis C-methylase UbiE
MGYAGAAWLDRADREATEQPEHVLDVIGLHDGEVVADIGAGTGYFSVRIARRVSPHGKVLATDLQPEMLNLLRAHAAEAGVDGITTISTTPEDAKLPTAGVDVALMVDVYHELPEPRRTLEQVHAALAPQGRLVLVEYRGEDPSVPIKPEHKMTLAQIRREIEASGFGFALDDESLPQQRIVVFRLRE